MVEKIPRISMYVLLQQIQLACYDEKMPQIVVKRRHRKKILEGFNLKKYFFGLATYFWEYAIGKQRSRTQKIP